VSGIIAPDEGTHVFRWPGSLGSYQRAALAYHRAPTDRPPTAAAIGGRLLNYM